MQRYFFKSVLFIFLFSSGGFSLFCEDSSQQFQRSTCVQKIYLDPDTIFLTSSGIEIRLEDGVTPIDSLFVDEGGLFTLLPPTYMWICGCGAKNPYYINLCWKCNRNRDECEEK